MASLHSYVSRHFRGLLLCFLTGVTCLVLGWSVSELWQMHCAVQDQQNIRQLNQIVTIYKEKSGKSPDLNLVDLYHKGLTDHRLHRTPYGGFYRLDPRLSHVYNPNR